MNKIFAVAGVVIKELYRRKDFYVLFILTVLITLLMASINFFQDIHVIRFVKEGCLFLILLAALAIAVTTTARQMPSERENRTIFPLLAKPISRWQVLLGKFVGCWAASGIALAVFYLFFAVMAASREHTLPLGAYIQVLWLHWQMLGVVIALTLLGSVVLSFAANLTIVFIVSLGILLVAGHLHKVASGMTEPSASILTVLYFIIPHLEFFDMRDLIIHDWAGTDLPSWLDVFSATFYGLCYMAFFLLAAGLVFRRKALN
ncbi:MAG TPA: ABC transporter permease subunit [Verrucomicrobiae bacterium]|nr:ABC transporter permease subunit [Verrucomicrobiae bacterium]